MTKSLHTLKGPVEVNSVGLILPHEHLFTDLRGPHLPDYAQAEPSDVVKVVQPYLEEAFVAGLLYQFLQNETPENIIGYACAMRSLVASSDGVSYDPDHISKIMFK